MGAARPEGEGVEEEAVQPGALEAEVAHPEEQEGAEAAQEDAALQEGLPAPCHQMPGEPHSDEAGQEAQTSTRHPGSGDRQAERWDAHWDRHRQLDRCRGEGEEVLYRARQ